MRISPSPCPLCHSGVALLVLLVLSIGSSSATSSGETTSPAPVTERLLVTDGGILHLRRKLHESNQTGSNSGPLTSLDSIRAFRTKQKDVGSYGLNTAYAVSPGGYGGPQGPIPAGFPLFGGPTIDDSQTPVGYSGTDSSVGSAQAWVDYCEYQ